MKNIIMTTLGVFVIFLWFSFIMLPLLFLFFIPVLPIMFLGFPMMVLEKEEHWSCRPYIWYFNKVWLKTLNFLKL